MSLKALSAAVLAGCISVSAPAFANQINPDSAQAAVNTNNPDKLRIDNENFATGFAAAVEEYEETNVRINDTLDSTNADHKLFKGISGNLNGGAIYNAQDKPEVNINSNFENNAANGGYGGAIFNYMDGSVIHLGDINGNFTNNTAAFGGAIYDSNSIIGNITGNFVGNNATGSGGAIYQEYGTIGNITGDFRDNRATSGGYSLGGAIYNIGIIGDIDGNFVNNSVSTDYTSLGGAIYNQGSIGNITGDFTDNSVQGANTTLNGGAISNTGGTIGNISGNFTNNSVTIPVDGGVGSYSAIRGGAIYNTGTIGGSADSVAGIINSRFIGNSLNITGWSTNSKAYGAAIYTNKDLNIIADNGLTEFTGNYVKAPNGYWGNGKPLHSNKYEAIYVDSGANLTMKAINNGEILMNDYINGSPGYNVKLTGDGTGTIKLYNDIKNANVTTNNVTIDMADGEIHEYIFNTLNSEANAKYNIDIDIANNTSDTINTTQTGSSGIITIDNLNILGDSAKYNDQYKIQILKNDGTSNNLQLAVSDKEYSLATFHDYTNDAQANANWDDIYHIYDQLTHQYGNVELATTDKTNDSILITVTNTGLGDIVTSVGDTLALWTELETDEVKNFNFDSADNVYTLTENLTEQNGQKLNINGVSDGNKYSTIDFDGHTGFNIKGKTTFNAENVEFKNASESSFTSSNINMTNVKFLNNNVIHSNEFDHSTNININADNGVTEFTGNYYEKDGTRTNNVLSLGTTYSSTSITLNAVNNGEIRLNDSINVSNAYSQSNNAYITGDETGTIKLYNDISNADVKTSGNVNIDMADGKIHEYKFKRLNSDADTKYHIDIDFANRTADTINCGWSGNRGTVTIDSLNILGELPTELSKDYKIQIIHIDTLNSTIQLALSENTKAQLGTTEYYLGQSQEYITDDIKATTNWDDIYYESYYLVNQYGQLGLATTRTTNDSIGMAVTRNEIIEKISDGNVIGDTLVLWTGLKTDEEKNFNFDSADNVYTLTEDLKEQKGQHLNINGVADGDKRSTIDFSKHTGFILSEESVFSANNVELKNAKGSAISINNSSVDLNNVKFTGNGNDSVNGGAIYNNGTIGDITAEFDSNTAACGGAIYNNNATIGNINGKFSNNNAALYSGGAIANVSDSSSIGNITGEFTNNSTADRGGAIYNESVIGDISGNFSENTAASSGGAIYNQGTIGDISGSFSKNTATNYGGGAIVNTVNASIGNIKADFIDNSASNGAGIFNDGTIGNIEGNFNNNKVSGFGGGGIVNNATGTVKNVSGNFTGNSANDGGAIYNAGKMGDITGYFAENTVVGSGGAIFNEGAIGNIEADFENNSTSTYGGGALVNVATGTIENITGNFTNNTSADNGGAIYNTGTLKEVKSNFTNNSSEDNGGAVYNFEGSIGNITGNFTNNSSKSNGGVFYNVSNSSIGNINGDFNGNSASGTGGAIYNEGEIGEITGSFENNTVETYGGGAIGNAPSGKIGNINGDFNNNFAPSGGAVYNDDTIGNISGNFVNNSATTAGGAITNNGTIGSKDEEGNVFGGIINANFIGNNAQSADGVAQGGAIYTNASINLIADGTTINIKDNYTKSGETEDDNAIYVASTDATVEFQLKNGAQIVLKDNIRGVVSTETSTDANGTEVVKITDAYNVNIKGDNVTGTTFYLHNDIYDADVTMGNTTIHTLNNDVHVYNFNSMTLSADTNMVADVDLKNQTMDRFTANGYGNHNGKLNVSGMNLLTDAPTDRNKTEIYFAQPGLKDYVSNTTKDLPDEQYQTAFSPIYKYTVFYDNRDDGGYFVFNRNSSGGNSSDGFNPAVLTAPVSTVAAAQAGMTEAFKYVFEHLDAFTQLPAADRLGKINANRYALAEEQPLYNGLSTDFNGNKGSFNYNESNKAYWFRPYATFENMDLKNGPKVDMITYGSIVGYDGDFIPMKHGWYRIGTTYLGYNGAQIHYKGTDTTTNGGLLGMTETYYKGNFWSALTVSAGASVGETRTMYGKEDYVTLMAGAASKTGYNFEFKEGKYIFQPIMYVSYTFANIFDFTNAAGVHIDNKPAHSIQLHPMIRGVANCKNGWQPYAQVGVVWNALNKSHITANGVRLPEMSMKPYVEYGVGVQRNWNDKFTAFGQAMIRNGGRNGVALTCGFRWALGKDEKNGAEKVQNNVQRKIVKQLSPSQKTAIKLQNTTRTSANAIIKQL